MHGAEADNPTPVDTFRYLIYTFKRKSGLLPSVAAKHMQNIEAAFGPEVAEEALQRWRLDVAAEDGNLTYDEDGNPQVADRRA